MDETGLQEETDVVDLVEVDMIDLVRINIRSTDQFWQPQLVPLKKTNPQFIAFNIFCALSSYINTTYRNLVYIS